MRLLAVSSITLFVACSSAPPDTTFDRQIFHQIDTRIEQAIADKKIPGGVYHLERNGSVYEKAYGNRSLVPDVEPMTADTIFDAASITKVAATTPAIWLLIQRGKIGLDDPAQRFIPEFPQPDITIRHLLTHTSG
ncbi:MAG TPA: serine hydrolase domain-containing protein, partial [Thermoanaerobaculia bacterium]